MVAVPAPRESWDEHQNHLGLCVCQPPPSTVSNSFLASGASQIVIRWSVGFAICAFANCTLCSTIFSYCSSVRFVTDIRALDMASTLRPPKVTH